ncbi:MAG: Mov34/MPN/PAD-1 family protein [Candidatus Entotheonellia bacterium]
MRIARSKAAEIYAQALAEFPFECCGMIIGPEGEDVGPEDLVRPCRNVQQDLHQRYPDRFPRDATIGYTMAKEDIEAIAKEAQQRDWTVKVCYHSHPNTGAYFSQEDRRNAEGWDLWFPGVRFVVLSAYPGEIRDIQGYRWDELTSAFVPVPVEVI